MPPQIFSMSHNVHNLTERHYGSGNIYAERAVLSRVPSGPRILREYIETGMCPAIIMRFQTERHLVSACPAMQPVRDRHPALYSPARHTMQLLMGLHMHGMHDIVGRGTLRGLL